MDNVTSGSVVIEVNGYNYTVPINDKVATLVVALPVGEYTAHAYYLESDKYNATNASSSEFKVVAKGASSVMIVVDEVYLVDDTVAIAVTATGSTGNVSITINGKEYALDADNKLAIDKVVNGTYVVVAVLEGDENYYGATDNATFIVNKRESSINVTGDEIKVGEVATISIEAPEYNGAAIVDIAGVSYYVKIAGGIGQLIVSGLTEDTYDVSVTYLENAKYL